MAEDIVKLIWDQLGGKWLAGIIVISAVLHYTGILKHWFGARTSERERLSHDQQAYIDDLQAEIDAVRRRRAEDDAEHAKELARLRGIIEEERAKVTQLVETNASLARGESRLRHALRGSFQYIAILRFNYKREGRPPPPFDGWRELLEFDPPFVAEIKDILEGGD